MRFSRSLPGIFISCAMFPFVLAVMSAAEPEVAPEVQKELDDFRARCDDAKTNRVQLRDELLTFRRKHFATPAVSHAAADLLAKLPSSLDTLDPVKIPSLDRFDWQPKELVAVLGEHQGRQGGDVSGIAFSPDGKRVYSGGYGQTVRIWDTTTMRQVGRLSAGYATAVVFSPDGKTLAVSNISGSIYLFDMTGAEPKAGPIIPAAVSGAVHAIAFSPDNKRLACGNHDHLARLYDLTKTPPTDVGTLRGHTKAVAAVGFSTDGKLLATGSSDGTVRLWDVSAAEPKETAVIAANKREVTSLMFAPDGRTLAVAGLDGTVRLWNVTAAKPAQRAEMTHGSGIQAITYSTSGRTLASAGQDGLVKFWDMTKTPPTLKSVLEGHTAGVLSVAFNADGTVLASGSSDWTVRLWDIGTRVKERFPPKGHLSHVYALDFAPDGSGLASGSYDRTVRLWNVAGTELKERPPLKAESPVYALAFAPDGKKVAAGGQSAVARLWETATGREVGKATGLPGYVSCLAFAPDDKQYAAGCHKTLMFFDAATGREATRVEGHETYINALAYSPDGKRLLSAGGYYLMENGKIVYLDGKPQYHDCIARLWDMESYKQLHALKKHVQPIYCAAIAPDGRRALTGSGDAILYLWDLTKEPPAEVSQLKGTHGHVSRAVFAPDGRTFATHGPEGLVILWDAAAGKRLKTWTFHENVGNLAFAADSRHLAVSLGTGPVYVLRLSALTGKE